MLHFQRDVVREGEGIGLGDPVVAPRRVIALPTDARQRQRLLEISRSRTEPTGRVERARIILAYLDDPSAYAVARAIGVTQQTVTRCLERAAELGVIEALDDRPRAGRDPVMTAEAKTWLVALACRKAKELGYPHELWTTRLLAAHARQHGPTAGHPSLAKLAQGTRGPSSSCAAWLRGLGLGQYESAFLANDVEARVLPRLTAGVFR